MQKLERGFYHGENIGKLSFKGLTISHNLYPVNSGAGWHYHENPHFTFILKGQSLEKRKKSTIQCVPGTLLFYPPHEPHCNERYQHGCRNLSIEMEEQWLKNYELRVPDIHAEPVITYAPVKAAFSRILAELKLNDASSGLSIEALLLQSLVSLKRKRNSTGRIPPYLLKAKEIANGHITGPLSLSEMAKMVHVHPVTLSREFSRYFHCTIGEYTRNLRIEKSFSLLSRNGPGIDEIAFQCGFYDTSHFTKIFKKYTGVTPAKYRESL